MVFGDILMAMIFPHFQWLWAKIPDDKVTPKHLNIGIQRLICQGKGPSLSVADAALL
jgi:hypothetical protein